MIARLPLVLIALVSAFGTASLTHVQEQPAPLSGPDAARGPARGGSAAAPGPLSLRDSAQDELAAGRFWHAARLLRSAGAADGSASEILTLARAEAGWRNWSAVAALLDGEPWLSGEGGGEGLYLLARAHENAERWDQAADAYSSYLSVVRPGSTSAVVGLARHAAASWRAGLHANALASLDAIQASPVLRSWTAAELALEAADDGDVVGLRELMPHVIEPRAAYALWRAEADALVAAGDSAAAASAFESVVEAASGARRAIAKIEVGRLWLAAGDTTEAVELLRDGLESARGSSRVRAAEALHDVGARDYDETLSLARILDRAGDGRRALAAYDRAHALSREADLVLAESARLERARLMGTVRARQEEALEEHRAIRDSTESERIGARNLAVWAQLRRRQGRSDAVSTLRRWLLEEHPSSSEAAEVAWSRGSNAEAGGRLDDALRHYDFVIENAWSHARAGESRMRTGQIHLRRSNHAAAAEVFERYLADFPDGRRWQQAAYWAGRTRLQMGDSTVGRAHLERVLSQPIEYYAVMAADLLGVPYSVDLPPGPEPIEPGWLTEGLVRLDLLSEAGVERGAQDEIERLRARAQGDHAVLLRLAEALIERGRTIDGINLGWAVLADGESWNQRLLRVTYPFPYEELVRREAAEWGVEVFMMAAIIRQESAFKADIVSRAGAIGLMQVMPPTGAQLARRHGPDGFTERALTEPEVNLHLGAAFFVDMSRRYENDLPLVLSAYNAGPTRATRWRRYPEASDPLRFTERIPFVETRGYVKNVRRNLELYRTLYGQD